MAFMGTIVYLPLFLQIGLGIKATNSGMLLLPLMAGLIISATLSGRVRDAHRQVQARDAARRSHPVGRHLPDVAPHRRTRSNGMWIWRLFIVGIGLGRRRACSTWSRRARRPIRQIGVATSTSMFLRQCGGMIGVSIFGAMLIGEMTRALSTPVPRHQ